MNKESKKLGVYDFNEAAEKEWTCEERGLRKLLLDFNFVSMTKPTETSKCLVNISNIESLNSRDSNFLRKTENFWIQLGSALTPIDYYIELFLQKMLIGETSRSFIKTKSGEEINFTIKLLKIEFNDYLFRLNVSQMFELASQYKQNGVSMFKKYPIFAQEYFCRAAKCLISFQPFDVLNAETDGIIPNELQKLFENIQTNIAACLIKQNRFEDVLYVTEFIENNSHPSTKAIYRRALAFNNLRKYSDAKRLLEKTNYQENQELKVLYNKVLSEWKADNQRYSNMMKKMFG